MPNPNTATGLCVGLIIGLACGGGGAVIVTSRSIARLDWRMQLLSQRTAAGLGELVALELRRLELTHALAHALDGQLSGFN